MGTDISLSFHAMTVMRRILQIINNMLDITRLGVR